MPLFLAQPVQNSGNAVRQSGMIVGRIPNPSQKDQQGKHRERQRQTPIPLRFGTNADRGLAYPKEKPTEINPWAFLRPPPRDG